MAEAQLAVERKRWDLAEKLVAQAKPSFDDPRAEQYQRRLLEQLSAEIARHGGSKP